MNIVTDKKLTALDESLSHGFFGREGGVSQGIYQGLNCGPGSEDDLNHVAKNRALVAQAMGFTPNQLVTLYQIHSATCLIIDKLPPDEGTDRPKGDAMVTDVPGILLGVLTADCAPVLFAGKKKDGRLVIGAAHSGWGGALKGVNEATIDEMIALGAIRESICATIGPSISMASYEVSEGFEKPFLARDDADERFFHPARQSGHLMFDVAGYVANRLAQHGVKQVTITGQDTYADKAAYYSYRRSTHAGQKKYGRQISVIGFL